MKLKSVELQVIACLFVLLAFHSKAFAPPGDYSGYHWPERSFAYADVFWNGTNPEYGRCTYLGSAVDCANFTSQIANAGCSGMAESNNTNWGDVWVPPNLDCWAYENTMPYGASCSEADTIQAGTGIPERDCNSTGTGWHTVILEPTHNPGGSIALTMTSLKRPA